MTDRSDRERRIIEALQALLLSNALQNDHLNLALDAMTAEDYSSVEMYVRMFADCLQQDIDIISAAASANSSEGRN